MSKGYTRSAAAFLLVFLMATTGLSSTLGSDGGEFVGGGMGFMDTTPWVDDFNDETKVHMKQNTLVTSGEVVLEAGQGAGLVASIGISPPVGYRYDMLLTEVDTPGGSSVKISVENATEPSTKVGYVNEPIIGFLKLDSTQISLSSINPKLYPEIRLQADLEVAGTDRPALLKWTVMFIAQDMWRDDFLGSGKMTTALKLNFTGDSVELNLTSGNLYTVGYDDHDNFPTLIVNRYHNDNDRPYMGVYYPNAAGDGYRGRTQPAAMNPEGFAAGDIDDDGYLDLLVANRRDDTDETVDSWILWGNSTGTFDPARRANLATDRGRRPALGDVNGDGYLDALISCGGGAASGQVRVFLNPGTRSFNNIHDIALPGETIRGLASADLNDDGYEDVVLAENHDDAGAQDVSRAYFGGPSGPDTTADRSYPTGDCFDVELNDFDGDEDVDIAFACRLDVSGDDRSAVYLGSRHDSRQELPDG
jgi:hypothetical protein